MEPLSQGGAAQGAQIPTASESAAAHYYANPQYASVPAAYGGYAPSACFAGQPMPYSGDYQTPNPAQFYNVTPGQVPSTVPIHSGMPSMPTSGAAGQQTMPYYAFPPGGLSQQQQAPPPEDPMSALYYNQPAAQAYAHYQYLPLGSNFLMPPGSGAAYMDPYGMMNPAALPPLCQQSAKKVTKKKARACC